MKINIFSILTFLVLHSAIAQNVICVQGSKTITSAVNAPNIDLTQATDAIIATNTINNGAGAIYHASNSVTLGQNFVALAGSNFHTYIAGCTGATCPNVYNLSASTTSDTSANLMWNWNAPSDIVSWEIEIKPVLEDYTEAYVSYNGALPYTVNSLIPGETYKYRVRSVCDTNSKSTPVDGNKFTMPIYNSTELLWNSGILWRNWVTLNDAEQYSICSVNDLSNTIPGKATNPYNYECVDVGGVGTNSRSSNQNPSLKLDYITYNFNEYNANLGDEPGFKFQAHQVTPVTPIEFDIYNQAHYNDTLYSNRLHEVGFLFDHWGDNSVDHFAGNSTDGSGKDCFKRSFNLAEFNNNIQLSFYAKVNKDTIYVANKKYGLVLQADLRFSYFDSANNQIQGNVLGVIFYEHNLITRKCIDDPEGNSESDTVLWHEYQTQALTNCGIQCGTGVHLPGEVEDCVKKCYYTNRMVVRGKNLNVTQCDDSGYKKITINYRDFINMLPPPPAGFTYQDAIIRGLDIYSSFHGESDLNFSIKDVRLIGVKPQGSTAKFVSVDQKNDSREQKSIVIYPNPNNGIFTIGLNDSNDGTIQVVDLLGRTVYESDFKNQSEFGVNLQDKPSGVYLVKVNTASQVYTSKIIKN